MARAAAKSCLLFLMGSNIFGTYTLSESAIKLGLGKVVRVNRPKET